MEEHFDQILIENNKRRNGAILRFDEKWDWISAHQFQKFPELWEYRISYSDYNGLPITSFNISQMSNEDNQIQNFLDGKNLVSWFWKTRLIHKAFDVDKLAKFFAIIDLLGANHSALIQNLRLYYNPINQKLELLNDLKRLKPIDTFFIFYE